MPPRPQSVTILSIIGLVWGGYWILSSLYAIASLLLQASHGTVSDYDRASQDVTLITICTGLPIAILLIFASLGSLSLKRPARPAMLTYAVLAILHKIATLLVTLLYVLPRMSRMLLEDSTTPIGRDFAHAAYVIAILVACASIITLALPICILYLYTRPRIIRAFHSVPPETPAEPQNALSPQ